MLVNCAGLPANLQKGLGALEKYGFLQISEEGQLLCANQGAFIAVEKSEVKLQITYDTEPHFYMALARSMGMKNGNHPIDTKGTRLGLMVDCSRNAVAKPEMVKKLICILVMAGYDYLELYTEDTYELPGEPYFGYKRGRYRAEELKEIIAFADIFQMEMVPCIQTLAHLKTLVNWQPYYEHMDIDDVLMVNDERTYRLIRKCLRFCREVFHTNRINIGSDEAYRLGRGRYTDVYGYRDKHELYLEHMKKVFALCAEEGFEPEFWADAFYDNDRPEREITSIFDGKQTPIVWRYRHTEAEQTRTYLQKTKKYAGKSMYAGALWKCYGYAPDNGRSERSIDVLFDVAEECGVDNILMTTWGNDGSECSVYAVMPSLWHAADTLYPCDADISGILQKLTGYTKEEWELCDRLNYVMPEIDRMCNASKYLLYNDFLVGLLDYNTPDHAGEIYRELLPAFSRLAKRDSPFAYLFITYEALCRLLIQKATYGKRLYRAYQENDRDRMRAMISEIQEIKENLKAFQEAFRSQWMKENKGFGMEVIDLRLGGLVSRTDTVVCVLNDYLSGRVDKIYELEEERLEYFCGRLTGEEVYAPLHSDWKTAYTVNMAETCIPYL